jgi:hypothetical protein
MRLRDLTRWNDRADRSQSEVVGLLHRTEHLATGHADAYRAERQALSPGSVQLDA